ncbi:NAD(P)-binding protein [Rhizodiscina lignyota]|uniref:NAD(P)-binding protein n=1 Tax=Rhizodiscina lignyota TaxID=1504668 RepID=A0A9P4ILZ5_9PEZI|nr:NAD(P)-binding protein [Rhizodiscina lignyota]
MRAIQLHQLVKGPDELKVSDLPDLQPAKDKYLIKIHAAATNFFDVLQIQGKHQQKPPFPWTAGNEFAGEVVATPTGGKANKFKAGDKVFGATLGTFATQVLVEEEGLRPVPQGWSFAEASGLFYTAPTAYAALVLRARAQPGDYVLVHGSAGALGLAAVQVSKALGMKVIATVNSAEKGEVAKRFGADYVLDSTGEWEKEARDCTPDKRGVDVVLDPLGMIRRSLKCIRWDGRLVVIGFAAGEIEKIPVNLYLVKNVSVSGLFWGMYATMDPQAVVTVWDALLDLITQGKVKPMMYTGSRFVGLEQAPAALKLLASGEAWGKIVIEVPQSKDQRL